MVRPEFGFVAPGTQRGYRATIDRFLVPAFGGYASNNCRRRIVQRSLRQHKT
jgi:hypothetical protein